MAAGDDINKSGDNINKSGDGGGSSSKFNLSFSHNKLCFIDGSCKRDNKNYALTNQWDMCNSVVVTWILNSLSLKLFDGVIYAKTAFETWSDLKETYDTVDGSVVFNLHKSINSLNQNGSSLAEYYKNLNSLWKQFDAMINLHPFVKLHCAHVALFLMVLYLRCLLLGSLAKLMFYIGINIYRGKRNSCFELIYSVVVHLFVLGSNNVTTNISPVSLSNEQLSRLMNLLSDNGVSSANANMAINVVDILNLGLTVRHPNGTQALITKIGDLKVSNGITLYDVLVVPEYTVSLLSVHNIARDKCGYQISLRFSSVVLLSKTFYGSHDFSRAVWVCMLKGKDDVYDSIVSFVQMLTNQFETNIKVFRSDNGTELVNNKLQNFFNDKGNLHQTSCVYIPQHNGIAERKHRHLLNVARSLMFQGELPLYL
ncbi:ribonuclease H-like domain-containing protein [Tanacetum coccineum]